MEFRREWQPPGFLAASGDLTSHHTSTKRRQGTCLLSAQQASRDAKSAYASQQPVDLARLGGTSFLADFPTAAPVALGPAAEVRTIVPDSHWPTRSLGEILHDRGNMI